MKIEKYTIYIPLLKRMKFTHVNHFISYQFLERNIQKKNAMSFESQLTNKCKLYCRYMHPYTHACTHTLYTWCDEILSPLPFPSTGSGLQITLKSLLCISYQFNPKEN